MEFLEKKIRSTMAPVLTALLAVGCGSHNIPNSRPTAAVTLDQLQTAVKSINTIDYLPFSQFADGCFARSLYMAMEIAIHGIPVSSQFMIATSGALSPFPGWRWNYHVAPVVWVEGQEEPTMLDPSLFRQIVPRSTWVRKLNATGSFELKFAPASETVVNSFRLQAGPSKRFQMISSLDEVGQFRISDITNSCRTMETDINKETALSESQRSKKRSRLYARTKQLARMLESLGLGPDTNHISQTQDSCY